MAEAYMGTIMAWAPTFAPRGWAFCSGQLLAISEYSALFSLLGTTYGGDAQITFGLPDLRGRVPIGAGQGPGLSIYRQGDKGGTEQVGLTTQQLAAHTHIANNSSFTVALPACSGDATTVTPGATMHLAKAVGTDRDVPSTVNIYSSAAPDTTVGGNLPVTGSITNDPAGGNLPHENRMPYQGVQYIICLEGIYPARE